MNIVKTKDYDKFAFVRENRDIVGGKKYKTLKESVEDLGYLISPVVVMPNDDLGNLVDLDGEELHGNAKPEYIVIDGQHRLTICRELDMPVFAVINDFIKRSDIIDANNTGNKWVLLDYVSHFKNNNKFDYVQLDAMIRSYSQSGFKTSAVIEAFATEGMQGNLDVKRGTYKIDLVRGARILQSCLTIKSVLPDIYQQVKMIRALKNIFSRHNGFDMSVVVDVLRNDSDLLNSFDMKAVPAKDSQMLLDIYAKSFNEVDSHSIPQQMREFIIAYYNGRCNFEGCSREANHVDHIKPYSKGGKTKISNLQLLCESCNKHKSNKEI